MHIVMVSPRPEQFSSTLDETETLLVSLVSFWIIEGSWWSLNVARFVQCWDPWCSCRTLFGVDFVVQQRTLCAFFLFVFVFPIHTYVRTLHYTLANWEQAGANAQRYEQYQRQLRQRELEQVTGGCCRCCSCLVVYCRS